MNRLPSRRLGLSGLALLTILAGLALRLVPWGLPLWAHHVGGGVLWGAMTFLLVAALRPPGWSRAATLVAAGVLDAAVEAIRLIHAPGLDAFRATLAGQLLLGRIFSPWNLVAYGLGILAAAGATHRLRGWARGGAPVTRAPAGGERGADASAPAG